MLFMLLISHESLKFTLPRWELENKFFLINQLLSVVIIIISFHLYKSLVSCCRFGPFFWSSPDSGSSFWCKSGISICFVYASKQAPKVLVVFVQPIDLPNIAKEKKGHSWVDKKFFLPSNSDPPVNSYKRLHALFMTCWGIQCCWWLYELSCLKYWPNK